jgi:hypothetical protein
MVPISKFRKQVGVPMADEPDLPDLLMTVIQQWETLTMRKWVRKQSIQEIFTIDTNVNIAREVQLEYVGVEKIRSVQQKYFTSTTWMDMTFTIGDPTTGSDVWLDTDNRKYSVIRNLKGSFLSQVKVVYDAGFVAEQPDPAPNPLQNVTPLDIQLAICTQAKFFRKRFSMNEIDVTQASLGRGGGATYMNALYHPIFESLAKNYQRNV